MAGVLACTRDTDRPATFGQQVGRMFPPLNKDNGIALKRVVEAEFREFVRSRNAVKIEMLDGWRTGVPVSQREGRAGGGVVAVKCRNDAAHETGFTSAKPA